MQHADDKQSLEALVQMLWETVDIMPSTSCKCEAQRRAD